MYVTYAQHVKSLQSNCPKFASPPLRPNWNSALCHQRSLVNLPQPHIHLVQNLNLMNFSLFVDITWPRVLHLDTARWQWSKKKRTDIKDPVVHCLDSRLSHGTTSVSRRISRQTTSTLTAWHSKPFTTPHMISCYGHVQIYPLYLQGFKLSNPKCFHFRIFREYVRVRGWNSTPMPFRNVRSQSTKISAVIRACMG